MIRVLLITLPLMLVPSVATAYIGPGLGVGAIGAIVGIFTAIVLALYGLFWYPIKRIIRKIRSSTNDEVKPSTSEIETDSEPVESSTVTHNKD